MKNNLIFTKIFFIFIFGLSLRLGYVLLVPQLVIRADGAQYDTMARNIITEHTFSDQFSKSTTYWAPGYPFFLSAIYKIFGINYIALRVVQAILSALVILFVYYIAHEIFNSKIAILSAIISCVYPGFIGYPGLVVSQNLVAFLITLSIFLIIKCHPNTNLTPSIFLGLITGYSSLVRSELFLFWPILFSIIVFINRANKKIIKFLMLTFAIMCLTVSLWTIRNYKVTGKFIPISLHYGDTLWISTWKEEWLEWKYEEPLISMLKDRPLRSLELDNAYLKAAINNIKEHPFIYLKMCTKRLYRFWLTGHSNIFYFMQDSSLNYLKKKDYFIFFIKMIMLFFNISVILLGFWGIRAAYVKLRQKREFLHYILLPILFFVILHSFLFATPRYSIPIMPFVIIFASYGITSILGLRHK